MEKGRMEREAERGGKREACKVRRGAVLVCHQRHKEPKNRSQMLPDLRGCTACLFKGQASPLFSSLFPLFFGGFYFDVFSFLLLVLIFLSEDAFLDSFKFPYYVLSWYLVLLSHRTFYNFIFTLMFWIIGLMSDSPARLQASSFKRAGGTLFLLTIYIPSA